jgi:Protein of unknown function (DUF2934)
MKSRTNQMSRKGSTCATQVLVPPAGTGTAYGQIRYNGEARQATPDVQGSAPLTPPPLTHEQIAERAKALWLASGRLPGRDMQNWLEAEAQLRTELRSA